MSEDGRYLPPPPYAAPQGPAYGPPPWPYAYGPPHRPQPTPIPTPAPRPAGIALAGTGALAVLVAYLLLPWYSIGPGLTTSDVRGVLDARGDLSSNLSVAYFSWFGWTLLATCAALAAGSAAAVLPRPSIVLAARIVGPIVAGFAALFTFAAGELTDTRFAGSDAYYLHHVTAGFWCALAGFVLLGLACLLGPRSKSPDLLADPTRTGRGATFGK